MYMLNNLNNEKWKVIEVAPDYLISSHGRVKSLKNNKEIILSPCSDKDGYYLVSLHTLNDKGKRKLITGKVHRLVALAFCKNKNKNKFILVNHLDSYKTNNYYMNLQWMDQAGNVKHAKNNGSYNKKKGDEHPLTIISDAKVATIRKKYQSGKFTMNQLAEKYGVSRPWIQKVVTHRIRVK